MKKKIILIHPPSPFLLIPKWTIPLTLLFLRAYLVKKKYDVTIVDLADANDDYLKSIPLDGNIYGISLYTQQDHYAKAISFYLKNNTNATVVAGGHHATFTDMDFLKNSAYDVIVRGEGEIAFERVIRGDDFSQIPGITYRFGENIIRNIDGPIVKDIDIYPFPIIEGINIKDYPGTYINQSHSIYRVGAIFSRGCVGKCAFCSSVNFWKRKVRFHSLEWIEQYISYLAHLGCRDIEILDDNFIIHRSFEALCRLFKSFGFAWTCMGISRYINEEKAKLMALSGCKSVALGIESASNKLLKRIEKISTAQDHERAAQILHHHGIIVKGLLIVGLPGEDQEDIDLTINFIKKAPIDSYGFANFVPLPGTPVWNNPQKYGVKIDKTIPFSNYLLIGKEIEIKLVTGDEEKVQFHREQLLEAMGDKCTIHEAFKRYETLKGQKKN